jgi:uncharacterized protein (DUF4415 family)
MSEDEVFFELDIDNPPPLTPEERAEIEANAPKSDADIDFSDIPRLTEEWFARARRGPFRPHKQQLTLRLDAPVVDWFKRHAEGGKGYQTAINRALRDYVAAQVKAGRR